jgi:hypothetical protein
MAQILISDDYNAIAYMTHDSIRNVKVDDQSRNTAIFSCPKTGKTPRRLK